MTGLMAPAAVAPGSPDLLAGGEQHETELLVHGEQRAGDVLAHGEQHGDELLAEGKGSAETDLLSPA